MLEEIRRDLQVRLDGLVDEAERLRNALAALGPVKSQSARTVRADRSRGGTPRRPSPASRGGTSRSAQATVAPTAGTRRKPAASSTSSRRNQAANGAPRAQSGGTKSSVLAALASGRPMTAGEVASATGLGRASVSTTLSKLAKSGEVRKAARGYERAA